MTIRPMAGAPLRAAALSFSIGLAAWIVLAAQRQANLPVPVNLPAAAAQPADGTEPIPANLWLLPPGSPATFLPSSKMISSELVRPILVFAPSPE